MAILDRLFPRPARPDALQGQVRVTTGIRPYSETPGQLWDRPVSSAGVVVDEYAALTLSAVFAAVNRLANITAMLPAGVYERAESGRAERPESGVSRILNIEANPVQTAFTARHFMQFWRPLFGAAVAEIGWDGAGRPKYLWPLEPWRVCPMPLEDGSGIYYLVDGRKRVAAGDMVYVPHVSEDGVVGKGFVHFALDSLGQALAADQSAGRFFQNDMKPGGLLKHPGNPKKEDRIRMREEWAAAQGGVRNRGKTGVLWGGWEWVAQAGGIDPDKAQLLETRQFSVSEVARWLNVPPHWLAELSRATFSNIESQNMESLVYTIQPILTAVEQEYDRKLLDPPRVYCKHNANALLRADTKTRGEFYRLMREVGAFTTNDVLALEDMNGIGAQGDRRFVPVNWQPLDDLATGGESQRAAAAAKQPTPGDTPPAEKPPAGQRAKTSAGLAGALEAVAAHALAGFAKKEINEAKRAAKKPGDVTKWMDKFYPDFEAGLADGLGATARLWHAVHGLPEDEPGVAPATWAAVWAKESREGLLAAMECRPEEWPNRSAALFTEWEGRAAKLAARLAGDVTDAAD